MGRTMAIEPLPTSDGRPTPDPDSVGIPLDRVLRRMGAPSSRTVATVEERWVEVVGESLAAHTRLVRVRDGVIVVAVDDPAWASELRWMGDTLAGRAREVLGDPTIVAIEVRVRPTGP
jgi:predicted nucleic acid-binding Zn ribbon protein